MDQDNLTIYGLLIIAVWFGASASITYILYKYHEQAKKVQKAEMQMIIDELKQGERNG